MITLEPPRRLADGSGELAETEAWSGLGLSRSGLSRFLRVAQVAVGLRSGVDVLLAGDRTLRRLNREFRGKDQATDVLSFPAASEVSQEHAGDLAISLETAQRQAAEQGHSLRDEVRVLLLHGVLHLAGMDHEVDRGEMAAREAELRVRLRLPSGLIARVGEATATARTNAKAKTRANADSSAARRNDNQRSKSNNRFLRNDNQRSKSNSRFLRNDNQKCKSEGESKGKSKSKNKSKSTDKRETRSGVAA